jgi:hypothetical protein
MSLAVGLAVFIHGDNCKTNLNYLYNFHFVITSHFRSLQIWSLASGQLLRSIVFPTPLNTVILDPAEYALYAGGVDGRIFITALNFGVPTASGMIVDGLLGTDAALTGHT